jgi:hypothetical protein
MDAAGTTSNVRDGSVLTFDTVRKIMDAAGTTKNEGQSVRGNQGQIFTFYILLDWVKNPAVNRFGNRLT